MSMRRLIIFGHSVSRFNGCPFELLKPNRPGTKSDNKNINHNAEKLTYFKMYLTLLEALSILIAIGITLVFAIEIGYKVLCIEHSRRKNEDKLKHKIEGQIITKRVITCPYKDHPSMPPQSYLTQQLQEQESNNNVASQNSDSISDDHQSCSICIESFKEGDIVSWSKSSTTCKHVFHHDCILPWLIHHHDCPCCRSDFINPCTTCSDSSANNIKKERTSLIFCMDHELVYHDSTSRNENTNSCGMINIDVVIIDEIDSIDPV